MLCYGRTEEEIEGGGRNREKERGRNREKEQEMVSDPIQNITCLVNDLNWNHVSESIQVSLSLFDIFPLEREKEGERKKEKEVRNKLTETTFSRPEHLMRLITNHFEFVCQRPVNVYENFPIQRQWKFSY